MWKEFLKSEGAVFINDDAVRFPGRERWDRETIGSGFICPLTDRAWIRVTGADAAGYLQGQLTSDVQALPPGRWQWAGFCNAKGRLHAVLRVLRRDTGFALELPRERAEAVFVQLRKYLLRAQAALEMLPEDIAALGVLGTQPAGALKRLAGLLPERDGDGVERNGALIYRVPGPAPRYVALAPRTTLREWWTALAPAAAPAGSAAWRWLDIVSGLPQVFNATAEEFVPQMMNLDLLDGISFKKGCYTGQEIVARMHYLGRLKQRMLSFHLPAEDYAQPGDRLFAADGGEQAAGTVVDGQRRTEGGCDLLAVVQLSALAAGPLHLHRPEGPALQARDLPYPLPRDG